MLAFLAMTIAALAAINQLTAQIQSYDEAYRAEYELMANALVLEQIELIDLTTDYDDLEDWDGQQLTRSYSVSSGDVDFVLTIAVGYVDDDGEPSETETNQKEVSVAGTQERYSVTLVTHTRIIAE